MGKPTGFLEFPKKDREYAPVEERVQGNDEFLIPLTEEELNNQSARCMDCGTPFCHSKCPLSNNIPDWNDLVYRGQWEKACKVLHSTNNFPEITGRVCPSPCQEGCTLNIDRMSVSIRTIECAIVDKGWEQGWIKPQIADKRTEKQVAIVGAGPAGLACAQQLARAGHDVVVYEKSSQMGGLARFGIPDFKLNKGLIDRRVSQMKAEGVKFHPNTNIGVDFPAAKLLDKYDAVVLTAGAEKPRDLPVAGRDLKGVHFAMEFLTQHNKRVGGEKIAEEEILATDKNVVVIGGGDTGSDCIGVSVRQGAASITQLEIMPKPPEYQEGVWPEWPNKLRTSSSHEEGCERMWSVATKSFEGKDGKITAVNAVNVEWSQDENGNWNMSEVAGSEFQIKADLVTLAMGFVHPVHEGMIEELGVDLDRSGHVNANMEDFGTSIPKVFAAGDMRRGQSLIVWAIREGRKAAHAVDKFLMGESELPQ
ncbi:MAG: glutamate synthase subunit beta [Gammaproteobacteria bacterium]|nr:MAG: glutamate synthase subunit beta [Gammaproteobacteria bacterium]